MKLKSVNIIQRNTGLNRLVLPLCLWDSITIHQVNVILGFMIESNEGLASELARVLPLTNPWDPNPVEVPYTENDDEEVKVKTIRKSPCNTFLGAFSKFFEAPDTEYTCLI